MVYCLCGADRPFGEHIRLAFEVSLIVQIFQGAEQEVAGILTECGCRATAVDKPIFLAVGIVLVVQTGLQLLNILIRKVFQLGIDQLTAGIPQGHQCADAGQRGISAFYHTHLGIFAVVNDVILYRITEIAHIGVRVNGAAFFFGIFLFVHQRVVRVQVRERCIQLLRQRALLIRHTGRAHSVGAADHLHFTADHFRVVDEILVQRDSVFCFSNVYPRCVLLQDSAAFLQKQNVGGHFRTGIALKRGIGQAYCADQVTPRCEILAHVL